MLQNYYTAGKYGIGYMKIQGVGTLEKHRDTDILIKN